MLRTIKKINVYFSKFNICSKICSDMYFGKLFITYSKRNLR